jgi:hypothetical protein
MAQLHKRFTDNQVKELMERYLKGEIKRKYLQEILGIKRRRFFILLEKYRGNPQIFSIQYDRKTKTRAINPAIEKNILKELKVEQRLIKNKDIPLKSYNYSFIRDQLKNESKQNVSLPTIINRAKKHGFYLKKPKRKAHDREVLTNYAGELIQHDSSYHLFAPDSRKKWYLITSIDDFSRYMFYARLVKRETSWTHIMALQAVFLKYGLPLSIYADSHSIFRFVQGRDSVWRKHYLLTDDADTQWKQVLNDCNVKHIPALSPQAKGKVERPYRWIQDHLVRLCVRENVADIRSGQRILNQEVYQYNYRRVHSTTEEVPYFRFQRALKDKKSLFRAFEIKPPYQSVKDIFCLRINRTVNSYRKISINNIILKVNHAPIGGNVNLRIYPNERTGLSEIRFWYDNTFLGVQNVKNKDLNIVHF